MPLRRRLVSTALAAVVVASLTACGTPPWMTGRTPSATPSATPTAVAIPTPTPVPTIETIQNDLAAGSTKRNLGAGNINITVDYFSTLMMNEWKAGANKPISFSLTAALATDDDGQDIFLSRVSVTTSVQGKGGVSLPAPGALSDQASVAPGYLVKSPYSYSQTFVLPAVDAAATEVTLSFTYELLLQTTPTSSEYAKQTATDTLTIAIAP